MKRATQYLVMVCILASVSSGAFDYVISDTYEYGMILNDQSLRVTGGGADSVEAHGNSYVEILGSTPLEEFVGGIYDLNLNDTSVLNLYAGEVGGLDISDNATALLQGGRLDYISSYQYVLSPNQNYIPHIEIVCKEYDFDSSTNRLTGVWMDDTAFDIQLVDESGYDPAIENIFFTPEPATLLLVGAGGLLLRRKKC